MKPARRIASVAVACAFLLGGCGRQKPAASPSAAKPVVFQTDWYAEAEQGGYYQALANGYYRETGLDVRLHQGGPGAYQLQKVATGQADFATSGSDDVILAIARGLPLVIVSAQLQHVPFALLLHTENSANSLRDLDGKTIMAEPGATWVGYVEARYGIHFNVIPHNYSLSLFLADKNFVQHCYVTNEPFYTARAGVKSKVLLVSASGYESYRVIVTSRDFARKNPATVRAFVAASIKGWADFLHGDPRPAKALMMADNPQMPSALLDFAIGAIKNYHLVEGLAGHDERIGLITRKRLHSQIEDLVRLKILSSPLTVDQIADFSFLPAEPPP